MPQSERRFSAEWQGMLQPLESLKNQINFPQLAPSSDQLVVAGAGAGAAAQYNADSLNEVWGVAFSDDTSHLAYGSNGNTVTVVPLDCVNQCLTSHGHHADTNDAEQKMIPMSIPCDDQVCSLSFGRGGNADLDGRKLTLASPRRPDFYNFRLPINRLILAIGLRCGRIRLYSVFGGCKFITELIDHRDAVREMAFSPDDSLVMLSASRDSTLKLWNLYDDCNMFKTLLYHQRSGDQVTCCAWAPNGTYVASGGSLSTLFIYETKTWNVHRSFRAGHRNSISACKFSPDSSLLASASFDTSVIVWNVESQEKICIFRHMLPPPRPIFAAGYNGFYVTALSYSSDGEHIATVCDDEVLRLWSIFEEGPVATAKVNDSACVVFSPDGSILAVGTKTGQVHLFAALMRVQKLCHLSRMAVRSEMHEQASKCIDLLPVPKNLKSYLKYEST